MTHTRRAIKRLFVILLLLPSSLLAQQVAPFKTGDRVMFVGNSITEAGYYHSYIWLYYMTRFPQQRIAIYNRGIGGDAIGQMNDRLDVEVFPDKPTVVALTFGMNDSGYFEYLNGSKDSVGKAKVARSYQDYEKAEAKLKAHGEIKKIIMTTAPYDATTTSTKNNLFPGKADAITQIAAFQEASARKNNWGFIDLKGAMTAINLQRQATDSAFSLSPGDRIHPDLGGHLVMAYFFLKAQGLAGKKVSDVAINAAAKKVVKAENSKITGLSATPSSLSFTYLANALPFPVDTLPRMWGSQATQADALKWIPFTDEFNQELLSVKALQPGRYTLRMDDYKIGEWTAAQFSEGINLALQMNTPQYQQAIQVRDLNQERMEIEKRFRQYNWVEFDVLKEKGLLRKHNQAALDTVLSQLDNGFVRGNYEAWTKARHPAIREAWHAEMKVLTDKIYQINKPVPHLIRIERID